MITAFCLLNFTTLVLWIRLWYGYSKYVNPYYRSFPKYLRERNPWFTINISIICGCVDALVIIMLMCIYCP